MKKEESGTFVGDVFNRRAYTDLDLSKYEGKVTYVVLWARRVGVL